MQVRELVSLLQDRNLKDLNEVDNETKFEFNLGLSQGDVNEF